jgi:hypothetical protein
MTYVRDLATLIAQGLHLRCPSRKSESAGKTGAVLARQGAFTSRFRHLPAIS